MPVECVFCAIIAGDADASIVYRDDATTAFMDLRAFHPGHTLVVPNEHIPDIFALDDATGAAVMATAVRVARAVRAAFAPDGINIMQSNGEAAGQEVFHLHVHVLPRHSGDGLLSYRRGSGARPRIELDAHAARIRAILAG
jgi:histidine triad (HIT) family protein